MTTDKHKINPPVSLHPDTFSDDSLVDMSLEQVFAIYHKRNQETRRTSKVESHPIYSKQIIKGVIPCLRLLSQQHKVSESEFSLCVSFKVLAELQGIGAVGRLSRSYSKILHDCVRDALFDELSVLSSGYNITYRDNHARSKLLVYPEVYSALHDVSNGCGTSVPKLYQVGLAMALSKSEEAAGDGVLSKAVDKIFKPEVAAFLHYMEEWQSKLDTGLT